MLRYFLLHPDRILSKSTLMEHVYDFDSDKDSNVIAAGSTFLRSRSLWDHELPVASLAAGEKARIQMTGPQQQPLLAVAGGFRKQGQELTIAVAEDLTAVMADIARFQRRFAVTAILMLTVLIALQAAMLRSGLRPLERVRRELNALGRGELEELTLNVPSEIAPLVGEVNRLLGVLSKRLERSRRAIGDLAHTLKKPLTIIRHLSDDEVLAARPEFGHTLAAQTDAMQRLVDRILRRARLAGEGPAAAAFSFDHDLPALLDTLRRMYGEKDLEFEIEVPAVGAVLAIDREDILELLGNLLDNACKWARRTVRLTVDADADVHLTGGDDQAGASRHPAR